MSAAIYFPSGDQRGEKSCWPPGIGKDFWVFTSKIAMPGPSLLRPGAPASLSVSSDVALQAALPEINFFLRLHDIVLAVDELLHEPMRSGKL